MSTLHPLLRFTLIAVGLYLVWFFGYEQYAAIDGHLDLALTKNIAVVSAFVLRLLGFDATVAGPQATLILLDRIPTVAIWTACNGMVLYALFTGFVVAFPGSSLRKLWFIPLGVALIYGINVLRIVALCLNHYYSQQTVDFNHHYTFTFIEYGCIFCLWIWWATRLATRSPNPTPLSHARA
jgi:exosortase family protein XrtF